MATKKNNRSAPSIRCGVDTGGTFTDLIGVDARSGDLIVGKFPSSASNPVKSIVGVMDAASLDLANTASIVVGTTLGLNALLQRRGASVIFLTTSGFEDVLFIQRMNRRYHYSFEWIKPEPLVERRNCIGVQERIGSHGVAQVPLTDAEMERVARQIEERIRGLAPGQYSIAVCLLFSYVNPEHEQALKQYLKVKFPSAPLSISHEIAPIWREYERGSTTVVDAFIKPILTGYIGAVRQSLKQSGESVPWMIMKSNGGHSLPETVERQPVNTVLSGLSGGILGAKYFGELVGEKNLISVDMGGTSCDVGLVRDGKAANVSNYEIEWGIPISAPFVDVNSIGAGGGSIARVDKGGFLSVGPQSAGAEPGPACYDQGGTEPTVTDANVVLGRINPDYFLGGKMKLNAEAAERVVGELANQLGINRLEAAQAIVDVADENMANAIRVISVDRGLDPRDFALVAFGGAGPLHTIGIAEKVGMQRIVVPLYPGLCSAFGTMIADFKVDKMLSLHLRSTDAKATELERMFAGIVNSAKKELREEGYSGKPLIHRSISMRYSGQNYEHEIALDDGSLTDQKLAALFERFHQMHEKFYGYSISKEVIEMIRLSVSVVGKLDLPQLKAIPKRNKPVPKAHRPVYFRKTGFKRCPIYDRSSLSAGATLVGPAVIEEHDSTILLHPGNVLKCNSKGVVTISL